MIFQINSICSQKTDENILRTLEDLPKDLPETFKRVLQKVELSTAFDSALRKKVFEVAIAAQRPLTLEELRHAVSIVPGDTTWDTRKLINDAQRLVDYCGSFLLVDEEYLTVHFIHHSVKKYLLSNSLDPIIQQYHVDPVEADLKLGDICVTYLNLDVPGMQLAATRNGPKIQPKGISAAILNATLPDSRLTSRIALKLLKSKGNSKYDLQHHLESTMNVTQRYRMSNGQAITSCHMLKRTGSFTRNLFFLTMSSLMIYGSIL